MRAFSIIAATFAAVTMAQDGSSEEAAAQEALDNLKQQLEAATLASLINFEDKELQITKNEITARYTEALGYQERGEFEALYNFLGASSVTTYAAAIVAAITMLSF